MDDQKPKHDSQPEDESEAVSSDDQKFDDFEARLKEARGEPELMSTQRMHAKGFSLAVEMTAAPLMGVLVGLGLDKMLDTKPLFMIIFFFLGGAAGLMRVYRVTMAAEKEAEREMERAIEDEKP